MASAGNDTPTVEVPTDLENQNPEDLDVFVKELMDNSKSSLYIFFFYMIHVSVVIFLPYRMPSWFSLRSGELYNLFIAMHCLKINNESIEKHTTPIKLS